MLNNDLILNTVDLNADIQVAYLGPDISQGPLPALFYFALSSEESLCQDPFNQPAAYLSTLPMRVFSLTLPGHGHLLPAAQAMTVWAKEFAFGSNFFQKFIDKVQCAVEGLIHQGVLIPKRLGAMGLSRGAFVATHVAAQIPQFQSIVGFAPLTKLSAIKEFQEVPDTSFANELDLEKLIDKVCDRNIRFYIGNLDTRVGTRNCFDFIEKASQKALEKKVRSPQIELIIAPSIGYQGHGTGKKIFQDGARWIGERLGVIDVM